MSVHITKGGEPAAFYDSVTGVAFGPVFHDESEAEDFLTWMAEEKRHPDVRRLPPGVLAHFAEVWHTVGAAWVEAHAE